VSLLLYPATWKNDEQQTWRFMHEDKLNPTVRQPCTDLLDAGSKTVVMLFNVMSERCATAARRRVGYRWRVSASLAEVLGKCLGKG
jgi:hypothetical protein